MEDNWTNWESGDVLFAPANAAPLESPDLLFRLASAFARIEIDWRKGDKWIAFRIEKLTRLGAQPLILEAERGLVGRTALISVTDSRDSATVCFFVLPGTDVVHLHYEPPGSTTECRVLAAKLAHTIGYDFEVGVGDQ
jgi:hypothetical protein